MVNAVEAEAVLAELDRVGGAEADPARVRAVQRLPARAARTEALPSDLPEPLPDRLGLAGVETLFTHQAQAVALLRQGRHVAVATGAASGKSLCYQLALMERLVADPKATALYLAPTKALARDQLRSLRAFRVPQVRAATLDGDTLHQEREALRRSANVVLTNPDMLHAGLLPFHGRWGDFFHRLQLVVVDECHVARGVFGAHVAAVLRRLRRVCARYRADPVFALASATIANPGQHASNLTGLDVAEVTDDGSPSGPTTIGLWEPPVTADPAQPGEAEPAPQGADGQAGQATSRRRSSLTEASELLAGLVERGSATVAFVKSRKAAEVVADRARKALGPLGQTVAAYRAGYLAEERREIEQGLVEGSLRGVAATTALELGVDIGELDAAVIAGWPGTVASLWQQAGRAGRRGDEAAVVFVADDDPLDHYLLAHPDQLWGRPVEAAVADITNPYVLAPHLRCAAYELPLAADEPAFAPADVAGTAAEEAAAGRLRARGEAWHWGGRGSPHREVGLRSAGGEPFAIVEAGSGRLVGDVDAARAFWTVHPGAVYTHQGTPFRVAELDLGQRTAVVEPDSGEEYTRVRTDVDLDVHAVTEERPWGRVGLHRGRVRVRNQVLAYERRRLVTDESLGVFELDLPPVDLDTTAVWFTVPEPVLTEAGIDPERYAGALHAAEHAAIALLPLLAMCDRWDTGGVSTPGHPHTNTPTIFIYDGYPGGVGITERGFHRGGELVTTTLRALQACGCRGGCPACVQSPKCGNGNYPLDKAGAATLLRALLDEFSAREG
jgi:DEAD/DEAH box helicase domain-containing protein